MNDLCVLISHLADYVLYSSVYRPKIHATCVVYVISDLSVSFLCSCTRAAGLSRLSGSWAFCSVAIYASIHTHAAVHLAGAQILSKSREKSGRLPSAAKCTFSP